ncbi:hypothetical protein CN514_24905 [Bacillus sp. AFS001701]|uniref:hypothetical protein n=1 Tax=Bacillus sp. AFS001701 TaxID=2033480 RepID=UPI000BF945F8|nr:hypothetical protein [Bacillus sp. AFS001701]PET36015.1 hypothetical protein CN514_24905 [Bacillus sp. AFS001701]
MVIFSCIFLFGCSIKSNTESKTSKVFGINGVTSIDTIIYSADKDHDLINKIEKGFKLKNIEDKQIDSTDLRLTFLEKDGKNDEFEVDYKESMYWQNGKGYKLDSKITKLLQEQFRN